MPTDYAYNYAPKGSDLRKPHDGHVAVLWPSLFRLRGEEYPIVYDLHHTSLLIRESKESFYMDIWHGPKLVLRLNGQVQAVTKRVITTAAL